VLGGRSRVEQVGRMAARSGEVGDSFKFEPAVHVLSTYDIDDLPTHCRISIRTLGS